MNARRVAKELEACTRGLNKAMPSTPPSNHPEQNKQVELWKKYLAWEKSNPLRTEDHSHYSPILHPIFNRTVPSVPLPR